MKEIPVEILCKIFWYCMPEANVEEATKWGSRNEQYGPQSAPLLMCYISRSWRAAATSNSRIWEALKVCVFSGKAYPSIEMAAKWIQNSGTVPLTLELYQENKSDANRKAAGEVLELFVSQLHRWANVRLNVASPEYDSSKVFQGNQASILEKFCIQNFKGSSLDPINEHRSAFNPWSFLESSLLLTSLHVGWPTPDVDGNDKDTRRAPWSRLSRLHCDDVPSIKTAIEILGKCSDLRECALGLEGDGPIVTELEEVTHNTLRTLKLSIDSEQLMPLLAHMTLPALKDCTIHVTGTLVGGWWPQVVLEGLLARSGCRLRRLELRNTGMDSGQLADCLRHPAMQTLEELSIDDRRDWAWDPLINDNTVKMLVLSTAEDSEATENRKEGDREVMKLMPRLEFLSMHGSCIMISTTDGVLADMVESRVRRSRKDFHALRRLDIDLSDGDHSTKDRARLKDLERERELILGLRMIV